MDTQDQKNQESKIITGNLSNASNSYEKLVDNLSSEAFPVVVPETESRPEQQESYSGVESPKSGGQTEVLTTTAVATKISAPAGNILPKDQELKNIENILSEGLVDIYKSMDPATQRQFKLAGEDTAKTVNVLLYNAKVKIQEIIDVILKWLKIIPGVNKFFIEQQAKIKTDKLIQLKNKRNQ